MIRFGLIVLLASGCHKAAPEYDPPPIPSGSRCFRLSFTSWSPEVSPKDIAWFMPPQVIALTSLPVVRPEHPELRRVLPDRDPLLLIERMAFAEWRVVESGETEVLWGNGFTGVRLAMRAVSAGLEGTAETFSDAPGGVHRSTVRAIEESCGL